MAGIRELKKRLKSVNTTEQLASAMKTVSSAKFSRTSAVFSRYSPYSKACGEIIAAFGSELEKVVPCKNPSAPVCVVVIASNRGLCGGYNSAILSFAGEYLDGLKKEGREVKIITIGRMAAADFDTHGIKTDRTFILPDVPEYSHCIEIREYLKNGYLNGDFSSVRFVYQKFKNTMTQIPSVLTILPLSYESANESKLQISAEMNESDVLYIPDRRTVMKNSCISCIDSMIYSKILEAANGAQAATLMAMREASDNAHNTLAELELEISRKRQSEVTAGVIETYSPDEESDWN